jgi:hypothetical protein
MALGFIDKVLEINTVSAGGILKGDLDFCEVDINSACHLMFSLLGNVDCSKHMDHLLELLAAVLNTAR